MDEPLKGVKLSYEDILHIVEKAREKGETPNLIGVNLRYADLNSNPINLDGVDLRRADITDADLKGISLKGADLSGADLRYTRLRYANLEETNLNRVMLEGANLSRAKLSRANLKVANLSEADLSEADLRGADLNSADLNRANLSMANLKDANLCAANLSGANLSDSELAGASLLRTIAERSIFANVDLSEVSGIDFVFHLGPSEISISTLYKSKGKIPEVFLRGCGVPDNLIEYVRSLTAQAFDYYSCFISYSSEDQEVAERLHADLQAKGVRCWFAPEDLKIGDKTRVAIDESIRVHDKLLLILSENSVKSEWVEHEVEHALDLERTRKKLVLFPVRLDDSVMESTTGWAGNIRRQRNIGNLTKWKDHDNYQKSFARLLRDLKAENNEL